MNNANGFVTMKLFMWSMGGLASLFIGGFFAVTSLGAWALENHSTQPMHSGAAANQEVSRLREDIKEIRADVKTLLRKP